MSWKDHFGFSDRLQAIQSLTTAYQQTNSSAAFADALASAKKCEAEAYDKAGSKEEYDSIRQRAIDTAERESSSDSAIHDSNHAQDENEEFESSPGEVIGEYTSCFPHFDGLHSTIYRSKGSDGVVAAVKVTVPHMMTAPHDAHREARLLREAHHPNVMPLKDTFNLDGGRFVLVFPFVRYDFEHLLRRDMVTASQIRSILRDMFIALSHIHALGIIHRDIKPSNILMNSPNGPAYLADFGISWKESDAGSEAPAEKITDVGTTCYRPPEILFGQKAYGTALDIWAAGCVVAEAIAVGHRQLFDSGPIGSDLSLIFSIFKLMGTPDEERWPEVSVLPDWGKVEFHKFPPQAWEDILPGVSSKGRDLVSHLLCYESSQRPSALKALDHAYFAS
ncbi:unnamed protein product [Penicillium olsonii]|uniref:cyclin-dependent kinase n=1 Tax=Penicillium olsonii TaxID=99116 RepID=A0A9W4MKU8_PENOL|nr:unnamed protein product [Penicillium olsonii]CAG8149014.1 unnamed protein product [Penicillium olsonii]CAG8149874.1 unnamed protein product [Penicillium olsonii]